MSTNLRYGALPLALVLAASLVAASPAAADWLALADGGRSEVRAVQIHERFVVVVTLNDKRWSLGLEFVDVAATRALNGMSANEELSPGWPRPQSQSQPQPGPQPRPEATVEVSPPAPPPSPPPPPPGPAPEPPERPIRTEPATVTLTPVAPPPPAPAPVSPPSRPEERGVRSIEDVAGTRVALFVNGLTEATEFGVTESRSYTAFNEPATFDVGYRGPTRTGYELGALVRIRGPVGIVASAEILDNGANAAYRNRLPHPFFFDRLRELSGEQPVSWSERAVHIDPVVSLDFGPKLSVDLFSGVSLFFTETELLDELPYEEVFPYDSLVSNGAIFRRVEARPLGYNVGVSTSLRILGVLGMNFGLRYSRAGVRLDLADGREFELDAGGLRFGAGLRLLIP